jgi:hypothetical protein
VTDETSAMACMIASISLSSNSASVMAAVVGGETAKEPESAVRLILPMRRIAESPPVRAGGPLIATNERFSKTTRQAS